MRWLPALNIVLGFVGFGWLLMRTSMRWDEYPQEVRKLLALTLALFFGLLATSVEMFALENQLTRSVVIIFLVKVTALYVLWATHSTLYRTGARRPDSGDGVNPDKDIP